MKLGLAGSRTYMVFPVYTVTQSIKLVDITSNDQMGEKGSALTQ